MENAKVRDVCLLEVVDEHGDVERRGFGFCIGSGHILCPAHVAGVDVGRVRITFEALTDKGVRHEYKFDPIPQRFSVIHKPSLLSFADIQDVLFGRPGKTDVPSRDGFSREAQDLLDKESKFPLPSSNIRPKDLYTDDKSGDCIVQCFGEEDRKHPFYMYSGVKDNEKFKKESSPFAEYLNANHKEFGLIRGRFLPGYSGGMVRVEDCKDQSRSLKPLGPIIISYLAGDGDWKTIFLKWRKHHVGMFDAWQKSIGQASAGSTSTDSPFCLLPDPKANEEHNKNLAAWTQDPELIAYSKQGTSALPIVQIVLSCHNGPISGSQNKMAIFDLTSVIKTETYHAPYGPNQDQKPGVAFQFTKLKPLPDDATLISGCDAVSPHMGDQSFWKDDAKTMFRSWKNDHELLEVHFHLDKEYPFTDVDSAAKAILQISFRHDFQNNPGTTRSSIRSPNGAGEPTGSAVKIDFPSVQNLSEFLKQARSIALTGMDNNHQKANQQRRGNQPDGKAYMYVIDVQNRSAYADAFVEVINILVEKLVQVAPKPNLGLADLFSGLSDCMMCFGSRN